MSRAEVLVTGFGPFPGVARNPSGWLAQALARSHEAVMAAVLPVCWHGAWGALAPLLDETRPRHVILFGVSRTAHGFQLERFAYNAASARADAHERTAPCQRLSAHGPDMREASLPVGAISAALARARLPVALSDDPGRYLCNAVFFHALQWAQDGRASVGFVHIPQFAESDPLTPGQALSGARLIVETATRAHRVAVPANA